MVSRAVGAGRVALAALLLAGGLAACSSEGGELCDQAAGLHDRAQLDAAARTYAQAQRADGGDDCASEGLTEVGEAKGRAAVAVAQGRAAEDADDLTTARARYADALRIDAANSDAIVGQRRVTQRPSSVSPIWRPAQRLLDEGFIPEARAEAVRVLRNNPDQVVPRSLTRLVTPTPTPAPSRPAAAPSATSSPAAPDGAADSGGDVTGSLRWLLLALVVAAAAIGLAALRLRGWRPRVPMAAAAGDTPAAEAPERVEPFGAEPPGVDAAELARLRLEVEELRVMARLTGRRVGAPAVRTEYWRRPAAVDSTGDGTAGVDGTGASLARLLEVRRGVRVVEVALWTAPETGAPGGTGGPGGPVAGNGAGGGGALRFVVRRRTGEVTSVPALQRRLEQEPGAFEEGLYAAIRTAAVPVTWGEPELWRTPVATGVAGAADLVDEAQQRCRVLLLGERVAEGAGAWEVWPGESRPAGARCLVGMTGLVAGVALGVPLLVNARVTSLAHDVLSQLAAETFELAVPELVRAMTMDERVDDLRADAAEPGAATAAPGPGATPPTG
jgi:hypothetical protein